MNKGRSWYSIEAKDGKKEADVFIYDTVGFWGVTANDFVKDLNKIMAEKINLRINSPGGDVFDGIAIFNALKKHPANVTTHIEALAASIASIIALAGDDVEMAENAFYMIHNPYTLAIGDADDMRHTATVLDKITGTLIKTYMNKTGKAETEIKELMDEETWFTSDEAKEAGFADSITAEEEVSAAFDLSVFNNVPQNVCNALSGGKPSPRKLEYALREAGGLSKTEAKAVVAKGYKVLDHRDDEPGNSHRDDDKKNNQKEIIMDLKQLKAEHPGLVTEIEALAREGYIPKTDIDAKIDETKKGGAEAELERIKSVKSQGMAGHEALIETLMFDGKTSGPEAAVAVLGAEKQLRKQAADDFNADGDIAVKPTEPGDGVANTMKRKEYDALNTTERRDFRDSGGKIVD